MVSEVKRRLIVVEGPIGVGKTSLALRLAKTLAATPVLEHPEDNPFLERFYREPGAAALPTQLQFLLQRDAQMQALANYEQGPGPTVADFLFEKERLFAELNLQGDELALYRAVQDRVALARAPRPDLVIYLQAPVGVLRERIARRGVDYERGMSARYLDRLVEMYARFFLDYQAAPVLIVNCAEVDLVEGDEAYGQLVELLRTPLKGHHYFNPLPRSA